MNVKYLLPFAVAVTLLCASCGGGSSSNTTPPPPPPPTGQVTIVSSFAGDTRSCSTTSPQGCLDHPDPGIGVGPSYLALFNRQGLTVLNRNGTAIQALQDAATFWANAGISGIQDANVTNPRATYDILSHRYYVVDSINAGTCGDLFAVSAMDDPTQWKAVNLSGHCGDWVMTVGYDYHGVYICEQLSTVTPAGSRCFAIPIADVTWTGGGNINLANMVSADLPSEGRYTASTNFRTPLAATDPAVIMSRPGLQNSTGTPLILNSRQWTWPTASKPVLSSSVTAISTAFTYYMDSFNPPNSSTAQPGGQGIYLRNWEVGRDISPVIDLSGNIWAAVGSDIGSVNGNTGFYWFRIPVSSMTVSASGTVYDSTGTSQMTFATPVVDATGNAYFFYGQGSAAEYLSHYVRVVPAGSSTMSTATLLKSGSAVITGSVTSNTVSFGTNLSAQTDAVDTTKVWIYGQYAANPAPYVWTTWVSEVDFH